MYPNGRVLNAPVYQRGYGRHTRCRCRRLGQKGRGIGSFLGSVIRKVGLPLLKKVAPTVMQGMAGVIQNPKRGLQRMAKNVASQSGRYLMNRYLGTQRKQSTAIPRHPRRRMQRSWAQAVEKHRNKKR